MAARIILRGDRPGEDRMVTHKDILPDYHSLPDFVDEQGQLWRHTDPEAWAPPDRQFPVYDRIAQIS